MGDSMTIEISWTRLNGTRTTHTEKVGAGDLEKWRDKNWNKPYLSRLPINLGQVFT